MSPTRARKVVLIGTKGFKTSTPDVRVDCFTWEKIKKITNLRDYDTIVINLLGISEESIRNKINWDEVNSILNIRTALPVLQYRGEIILVGDPRFSISEKTVTGNKGKEVLKKAPFLQWTGMKFIWDKAPGDTIHFKNDYEHRSFEEYISKFNKWDYSLDTVRINKDVLGEMFNFEFMERNNLFLNVETDFFCINRYKNGLAFILRLKMMKRYRSHSGEKVEPVMIYGPMVFLPKTNVSKDEILTIVLRDVCGVETVLPEPEWLSEYKAPGQTAIDEEVNKIREGIEVTKERLKKAQEKREQIRACLKLLYEREFGLEPAVRDILRGLGAHVEDPKEPNKEDGWITINVKDKVYEGVLEIKSTRSVQFGEDGIRQLLDWIDRGTKLRKKKYKGIFIGNSSVDVPINDRPWPFSDDWSKSVELHNMCALTTSNLYIFHLLKSAGKLDLDSFWRDVFETDGIFDNKKYLEMLTRNTD